MTEFKNINLVKITKIIQQDHRGHENEAELAGKSQQQPVVYFKTSQTCLVSSPSVYHYVEKTAATDVVG